MAKHQLITIVGNVGSGKSSLTEVLSQRLKATISPADSFYLESPFLALERENRQRWSLTGDLWFMHRRVELAKKLEKLLKKNSVVADSGLPMNLAYARSRLNSGFYTRDEWELYVAIHREFEKELRPHDIMIFLEASPKFLMQRIKERGREFEIAHYTEEYLAGIGEGLAFLKTEATQISKKIITVNTEHQDVVHDETEITALIELIGKAG